MLNREILKNKIYNYLNNHISQEDIYQWALAQAVSADFDAISRNDEVIHKAISNLMDIKRSDLDEEAVRGILTQYYKCLAGEAELKELDKVVDLSGEVYEDPELAEERQQRKDKRTKQVFLACRIYIIIFCVCSLGIHLLSILKPEFLRFGESIPSRTDTIKESMPHLLYAFVVLLPPSFSASGILFFVTFPLLTLGMFYYWYVSVALVTKLSISIVFSVVLLPFSAIPATLSLVLLVMKRNTMKKKERAAREEAAAEVEKKAQEKLESKEIPSAE